MINLDRIDKEIVYRLSGDMELKSDFFGSIAKELGIEVADLLERLNRMKGDGVLKRIAPILKHRNTEYRYNGMAVFKVADERVEAVVNQLKRSKNVSHIYERATHKNWPYNVYGMTHGKSKAEVESIVDEVVRTCGLDEFKVVYSVEEFKKTSPDMEYLMEVDFREQV